jgi:hypothetical protein
MLASTRLRSITAALVSLAVLGACSGGEKIVAPGSRSNSVNTRLTMDDSLYMANTMSAAAAQAIKGIRQITTPDLPGVGRNAPPCTASTTVGGADANGNGIPDDRTVQFTAAGCTYNSAGATIVVTGSIRTQDIGGLYAFRVTYTNFSIVGTKADSTVRAVVNGAFEYRWTSATAAGALDNSTLLLEVRSGQGSMSLTRVSNLTTQFAPLSGNTIAANRSLPSGDLTMTGDLSVTAAASGNALAAGAKSPETLSMTVNTTVPLTALSSCNIDPVFNAGGTLVGAVSGVAIGSVSVRFAGCGQGIATAPGTRPVGKR